LAVRWHSSEETRSLIVSFAFALVQLVGQIDAEKHCAKGLWLEKLSHRT